jgi:hypothetical protein
MAAWPVKAAQSADRAPPGLALAYAAQAGARQAPAAAVTRGIAAGSAMPRQDAATQFRVATAAQPVATPSARGAATAPVVKAGLPLDDLWVRALFLAPNLRRFMTATLLGQPDMRELQPLMEKPDTVVTMGFGVDPMPGLTTERFTGNAVVFVATTTFARRTAALP